MKNKPLISVISVTYNVKDYIKNCVEHIYKSDYEDYEVIVIDNGSTDGTTEELKKSFGHLKNFKYIYLEENKGPAYARNQAVKQARGKYIAFLDSDTMPQKEWLTEMVKEFEENDDVGAVQCKLLLARDPKLFDYAGDYLSNLGFLIQRVPAEALDDGSFDQKDYILSAKSAAMGIRKEVFDEIEGFDEDYFIYTEETDLGWRVWLAGYKIIFLPSSVVHHEFSTLHILNPKLNSYNVRFHGTKNYITTMYKNLGSTALLKILPLHFLLWLVMTFLVLIKGRVQEFIYMAQGITWPFMHFSQLYKKRQKIQGTRKVSDTYLMPIILKNKPITYFLKKFFAPQKVEDLRRK